MIVKELIEKLQKYNELKTVIYPDNGGDYHLVVEVKENPNEVVLS